MLARNQINKEKLPEKTFKLIDLKVGDVVRFKGTRDKKGLRKILRMSQFSYYCQVMTIIKKLFFELDYTSVNGIDKLTHVLVQGELVKVVQ